MLNLPLTLKQKKKQDSKICPDLTFKERIYGFVICCVIGRPG